MAINSQYYHIACRNDEAAAMREAQERWMEEQFEAARWSGAKHVVLLSHVTPFMGQEEEPQGHFNWEVKPRQRVLALAARAGVRLWLCGHYHGNCVARSRSGIEIVTTSSCGGVINWAREPPEIATNEVFDFRACVGSPPVVCDAFHSGMRVVRVEDGQIRHQWLELASVPKTLDAVFEASREEGAEHMRPSLERIMDLPTSPSSRSSSPRKSAAGTGTGTGTGTGG